MNGCMGKPLEKPPLQLGGMWLPWSSAEGHLMCTPWPYVNHECLSNGRGMLPWEYNHMLTQHADSASYFGTIHALHDDEAAHAEHDTSEEAHFGLTHRIVQIEAATEFESVQPLHDKKLLLLDNLVHVVFNEDMPKQKHTYNTFWQECMVLDTAAYTAMFDVEGNRGRKGVRPMADLGLSHQPACLRKGRLHRSHGHLDHHLNSVQSMELIKAAPILAQKRFTTGSC